MPLNTLCGAFRRYTVAFRRYTKTFRRYTIAFRRYTKCRKHTEIHQFTHFRPNSRKKICRRNLKSVIYFTTFINCRPKAAFYADSSAAEISKSQSVIYFTTFINCRPKAAFYADSSAAEISKRYLFYDFYKLPSQSRFLRQFFRRRNLKALSILRLYPAVKKDARRLFGIGHFRRNCPHFRKKSGEDSESPPFFVIPMLRLLGFLCWGSRRLWCIPLCTLPVFSNDRG